MTNEECITDREPTTFWLVDMLVFNNDGYYVQKCRSDCFCLWCFQVIYNLPTHHKADAYIDTGVINGIQTGKPSIASSLSS